MTEAQFRVILQAIADVQQGVDALGVDMERALVLLGESVDEPEDHDPQPPSWVNGEDKER
jgi:hypothetical protein